MFILVTRKADGAKLLVNTNHLVNAFTHIETKEFGIELITRDYFTVVESPEEIYKLIQEKELPPKS